jgi:hypothetical protein
VGVAARVVAFGTVAFAHLASQISFRTNGTQEGMIQAHDVGSLGVVDPANAQLVPCIDSAFFGSMRLQVVDTGATSATAEWRWSESGSVLSPWVCGPY